jgi:starch-binding outer membrane protein SusE/F
MRTIAKSALLIGALSISFVACKKDKKTVVEEPPVVVTPPPAAVTSYLYLPGKYQGWDAATAPSIHSTDSAGKYYGYIKFDSTVATAERFEFLITFAKNFNRKLAVATAATPSLGLNPSLVQALQVGASDNIKLPTTGIYELLVDTVAKKLVAKKADFGLIGDATLGGWTTSSAMTFNTATQKFTISNVALIGGKEIKFRANNDWGINYGTTVVDGPLTDLSQDGKNIKIATSGNYDITLDVSVRGKAKATITKL